MRVSAIIRQCTFVVLGCIVTAAAVAGPPIPRSMFCRQFVEQPDGTLTGPVQFWAEGNNMRGVMLYEGRLIHTLQLGDTLFTWADGDREGRRQNLGDGLASYGLIRQIERIRSLGTWDREVTVDGVVYEQYRYAGTAQTDSKRYEEHVSVSFDARSGAPKVWLSEIMVGGSGVVERMSMVFRDTEVNITMPNGVFDLPEGVVFTERK
jgi:hypothetical protein